MSNDATDVKLDNAKHVFPCPYCSCDGCEARRENNVVTLSHPGTYPCLEFKNKLRGTSGVADIMRDSIEKSYIEKFGACVKCGKHRDRKVEDGTLYGAMQETCHNCHAMDESLEVERAR